jgi:hypothetical protein
MELQGDGTVKLLLPLLALAGSFGFWLTEWSARVLEYL